jgi:uncharacterized protein YbbC (DUF1343 family)
MTRIIMRTVLTGLIGAAICLACSCQYEQVVVGAAQTDSYLPVIGKLNVAVVANQTSLIGDTHLVDSLLSLGVRIGVIFSPEHGFRGDRPDGADTGDGKDPDTGIPVVSLYGPKKKPDITDLQGIDLVIFDIQDVGTRFYTYISTLHYVMQACAENRVRLMILDRPNPNGFYVDGPILEERYTSFVGMHPVPVVHGMTVAEYARMINGEGWLGEGLECELSWVPCLGYDHRNKYRLPVNPSPNLQCMNAIYLYPSLCFFEGTAMSVGRGTDFPFEVFGHPDLQGGDFTFTPEPRPGASDHPKLEGMKCYGRDLRDLRGLGSRREGGINLEWLLTAYSDFPDKSNFFNAYFEKLAGTSSFRQQIVDGWSSQQIKESWESGLQEFRRIRQKYLLYPD